MRSFIISFKNFFLFLHVFIYFLMLFIHFVLFFLLLNVKEHKMPKGYIIITNIGSQFKIFHTLVSSFNLHCLLFLVLLVHSLNRLYTVNVAQVFHKEKKNYIYVYYYVQSNIAIHECIVLRYTL